MHSSPTSAPIRLISGSPVVVLDDVAHCPDGCQVFVVAFRVDEMEGAWNLGVPVRAREVDGDLRPSRGEMEDTHSESYHDDHMGDLTQTHTHICFHFCLCEVFYPNPRVSKPLNSLLCL